MFFSSCELIALPIDSQQELCGDFDGDRLLVIKASSVLFRHIQESAKDRKTAKIAKLEKTHTSSFKIDSKGNERYLFGRAQQIRSVKKQVLEQYASFQFLWLSLSKEDKQKLAHNIIDKLAEKEETALLIKRYLPSEIKEKETRLDLLITLGIKAGSDAFKVQYRD